MHPTPLAAAHHPPPLPRCPALVSRLRCPVSMMRVVALNAPDSKVAERRFRSRFTSAAAQQQMSQEGDGSDDESKGERAVALCMELVHREGCAVAEEANEILRYTRRRVFCFFSVLVCLLRCCIFFKHPLSFSRPFWALSSLSVVVGMITCG